MAVNYTLANLRTYVRDLTGIYSYDIVTDAFINRTINDVYFELAVSQNWSWSASVPANGLTTDASYPVFPATYHSILAYRTAAEILRQQGDDTERATTYDTQANDLQTLLYVQDLPGTVDGAVSTYAELVKLVRQLVSIYDNSLTNTYIQNKLIEEYQQLNEGYNWPWKSDGGFPAAPTSVSYLNGSYQRKGISASSSSTFNFAKILAYGVATKIAAETGKEALVAPLQAEYDSILNEMTRTLLTYGKKTVSALLTDNNALNLENLVELSRQLIGDYSSDIPNGLLQQWVLDEAVNLAMEKDWPFLRSYATVVLAPGQNQITVSELDILSAYVVNTTSGDSEEVKHRPHLLDVSQNNNKYYYTCPDKQTIIISPVPTQTETFNFYTRNYSSIGVDNGSANAYVLFSPLFKMLIPYRVAIKGIAFSPNQNNKALIQIYQEQAYKIFENMVSYYMNEKNMETIQLGVQGVEDRKYIPYFRVN
jgi:hypothetical protein